MKPLTTLKEVRIAWNLFNNLPVPVIGAPAHHYKNRESAWVYYTKVRDQYLYQIGVIMQPQDPMIWYQDQIRKQ